MTYVYFTLRRIASWCDFRICLKNRPIKSGVARGRTFAVVPSCMRSGVKASKSSSPSSSLLLLGFGTGDFHHHALGE